MLVHVSTLCKSVMFGIIDRLFNRLKWFFGQRFVVMQIRCVGRQPMAAINRQLDC